VANTLKPTKKDYIGVKKLGFISKCKMEKNQNITDGLQQKDTMEKPVILCERGPWTK
jgi:hypothetical protein